MLISNKHIVVLYIFFQLKNARHPFDWPQRRAKFSIIFFLMYYVYGELRKNYASSHILLHFVTARYRAILSHIL